MEVMRIFTCVLLSLIFRFCYATIHKFEMKDDGRKYISLSTFGFYEGGILGVKLRNFRATPFNENHVFGFSLDRTMADSMELTVDSHQKGCLLQQVESESNEVSHSEQNVAVIYFILDFKEMRLRISCSDSKESDLHDVRIYKDASEVLKYQHTESSLVSQFSTEQLRHRRSVLEPEGMENPTNCDTLKNTDLPVNVIESPDGSKYFNASFAVYVTSKSGEGLYNLYFHNCPSYKEESFTTLDFSIEIEENNNGNFLSAGEMPLSSLSFMMSLLFFLSGCFWIFILRNNKHPVYKIHYLMAVLVYLKSLSLLFHGVNFYFIQIKGEQIATWAILYYIAHLLKGVIFYATVILIGAGWTFIKQALSGKDKKILMVVIPLQVFGNVAEIIIQESEEGAVKHQTWRTLFILEDLLCSGAILLPVIWSIKNLQEASHRSSKAACNFRTLFRHFFIMIICYIYCTKIIVYLLKMTVPFQYEWLSEMFLEFATFVFYVLTAYKFRPSLSNLYFLLSTGDDKDQMDVMVKQSGLTEGSSQLSQATEVAVTEMSDEEDNVIVAKRGTSYEFY